MLIARFVRVTRAGYERYASSSVVRCQRRERALSRLLLSLWRSPADAPVTRPAAAFAAQQRCDRDRSRARVWCGVRTHRRARRARPRAPASADDGTSFESAPVPEADLGMQTQRCACFGWCDPMQIDAFLAGLPLQVTSTDSPWYRIAKAVYRSEPALPLNMREFGLFTFAAAAPAAPAAFDAVCDTSAVSWCGHETCGGAWNSMPMPNISLPSGRRRGPFATLAPWAWNSTQRTKYNLPSSDNKVRLIGSGHDMKQVKVLLDGPLGPNGGFLDGDPLRVHLARTLRREADRGRQDRSRFHANHAWIEVYRTVTNTSWNVKNNLWEGVNYGCWFSPLQPPLPRGTGIFVNTGRSMRFWTRIDAHRFFKGFGNWTRVEADGVYVAVGSDATTQRKQHAHAKVDDAHWATKANAMGYDSVQLLHGADSMPELLVASQSCLTQTRAILTCPPVELRTGARAHLICRCSDAQTFLNCDETVS